MPCILSTVFSWMFYPFVLASSTFHFRYQNKLFWHIQIANVEYAHACVCVHARFVSICLFQCVYPTGGGTLNTEIDTLTCCHSAPTAVFLLTSNFNSAHLFLLPHLFFSPTHLLPGSHAAFLLLCLMQLLSVSLSLSTSCQLPDSLPKITPLSSLCQSLPFPLLPCPDSAQKADRCSGLML